MIRHLLIERVPYDELPLNKMDDRYLLAIENAINVGWQRMKRSKSGQQIIAAGIEDQITARLQEELNVLRNECPSGSPRQAPGFTNSVFAVVTRSSSYLSYDAKHLNKSPDLVIRFKTMRRATDTALELYDALFVECKPLGKRNPLGDYGTKGIQRFINGEYAWAMPHALMIGYVKNAKRLPDDLDLLTAPTAGKRHRRYGTVGIAFPCKFSPGIHVTRHKRPWKYSTGKLPGEIQLRHLWLLA